MFFFKTTLEPICFKARGRSLMFVLLILSFISTDLIYELVLGALYTLRTRNFPCILPPQSAPPVLLHQMPEVCPLTKAQVHSVNFALTRFLIFI